MRFLNGQAMLFNLIRFVAAIVTRVWLRAYNRLNIQGRENLPLKGPLVLVANHASHLDVLCLQAALPLSRINRTYPAAAADYFFARPICRLVAELFVNAISIDRAADASTGIDRLSGILAAEDKVVILFPEGTRSCDGKIGPFKPGVGLLAAGSDVPFVPCHIKGAARALAKGKWIPRPRRISLTIGPARTYATVEPNRESAERVTQHLRDAVNHLAGDEWRALSRETPQSSHTLDVRHPRRGCEGLP